jgi:hypothetical protein
VVVHREIPVAEAGSEGRVPSAAAIPGPPVANVFRREGHFWTLVYGGKTVRVKDAKGLRDIARLLARHDEAVHVADLVVIVGDHAPPVGDDLQRARVAVAMRIRNALKRIQDEHPALGRHLSRSINTGIQCCYVPETPVHWDL